MDITIFTELTTSDQLNQLKKEAEKYTGLYVDMEDKEQRKYVKDKASEIEAIKKKVERARIDKSREYKMLVEKEAASILEDLTIANLPFTLLIDEHKAERKKILDAEKARKDAVELAIKIEGDHEFALLMNSQFDQDKLNAERERIEYEENLKKEAVASALVEAEREKEEAIRKEAQAKEQQAQAERDRMASIERERLALIKAKADKEQAAIDAEQARLESIEAERLAGIERQRLAQKAIDDEAAARAANTEHLKKINNEALDSLLKITTLPVEQLKIIIRAIAKNEISHIKINY